LKQKWKQESCTFVARRHQITILKNFQRYNTWTHCPLDLRQKYSRKEREHGRTTIGKERGVKEEKGNGKEGKGFDCL